LKYALYNENYHIICATESWLYTEYPNGLLDPNNCYTIIRDDRDTLGGGVCVFIRQDLNCVELKRSPPLSDVELTMFDVLFETSRYRFAVFYRKPTQGDAGSQAATNLVNILRKHNNNSRGPMFVLGDFNCPHIDWSALYPTSASGVDNIIRNYFASNGFAQLVSEATRENNILDVVCTDEPILVSDVHTGPAFGNSDHNTVLFTIDAPSVESNRITGEKVYMWSQADYTAISKYLASVRWTEIFTVNFTADDIWNAFCTILNEAIDLFVPTCERKRTTSANIKRYPRHIRKLYSRKLAVWRKYKANRSDKTLRESYEKISAECRLAVRKYEIARENKIIESNDVGNFFRFVNNN